MQVLGTRELAYLVEECGDGLLLPGHSDLDHSRTLAVTVTGNSVVNRIRFRYGYEMRSKRASFRDDLPPLAPARASDPTAARTRSLGRWLSVGVTVGVTVLAAGCSTAPATGGLKPGSRAVLNVVAAENTWGSLATQLGGRQVHVTSIISDPNADPHEYESSASDARAFAAANFVILNGVGYDDWAGKLLAAQPEIGRRVLTVGTLVGKTGGDNPHLWYDPSYVYRVLNSITATYESIEPAEKAYFIARHTAVEAAFAGYRERLSYITQHYADDRVGSTESIFQYMAEYLHLDLVTPYSFMKAVAEGTDPPASSVATVDRQIASKAFQVLVYNVQTVTPLTTTIKSQAAQEDIPVIGVSETIQPPIATFEEWMDGQLDNLADALAAKQLGK